MKKLLHLLCFTLIFLIYSQKELFAKANQNQTDPELRMRYYLHIADSLIRSYNPEAAKVYLDSASIYEKEIENKILSGTLYSGLGDFYSLKRNEQESHKNYYKAIGYYEKAGNKDLQIPIYHNLAFSYIQKRDTESLRHIISKMLPLALSANSKEHLISTYRVMAFYYGCLYQKDDRQTLFLDSAIYYNTKLISIYENTKMLNVRPDDLAYDYLDLASNLLMKKKYDPDLLVSCLKKSEKLANPADTAMIINQYWIRGEIEYQKGNINEADKFFQSQLSLMNQWPNAETLSMYIDVYDRLSKISESKGNFKDALGYQQKVIASMNQIHDRQKYETIRELEVKYEVERKEQEITYLKSINDFREKINLLYACIIAIGIIAFIFIIRWFLSKKKASEIRLTLLQTEKNEIMLHTQLQEERLKTTELEKYEALLDNHFKNIQISKTDTELEKLRQKQLQLNIQIENYSKKVSDYEKRQSLKPVFETKDPYYTSILRDVFDLISKKLNSQTEKNIYIENLLHIPDLFFQKLHEICPDNLSVLNLKHCICFRINMENQDIADCFSIEVATVHIIRHRLKAKLNLDKINLDMFLKQLIE